MNTKEYRPLPEELGSIGGFGSMGPPPGGEMPQPSPEMLARMEQDKVCKEARKPIAALFQAHQYEENGEVMPYRLYVPEHMEPEKKYPLVLFLHGAGERGEDNISQLIAYEGALIWVRDQLDGTGEPCFVLAPQCPGVENHYWLENSLKMVGGILDKTVAEFPVDETRISLTGMSMGGGGCWRLNYMYPERFSAIVPICSAGGTKDKKPDPVAIGQAADAFAGKNLWIFHAADDFVVTPETSRGLVKALEERGKVAGEDFFYTEYPESCGYNHGSWTPAYENEIMRKWMLRQKI